MAEAHEPVESMGRLTVNLLGPLEVSGEGRLLSLPAGKQRALLATLAVSPRRVVPIDEIIYRLWDGRPPAKAGTTVRGYVKRLRRVLDRSPDGSLIRHTRGGYWLDIAKADTDIGKMLSLMRRAAATTRADEESTLLDEALSLWRGAALCDVTSHTLQIDFVPLWTELRLQAIHRRVELSLAENEVDDVIPRLHQIIAEHPLEEQFWSQLMRALCRVGRPAAALAQYETCRRILADRLGVDPGPHLRALHGRILAEDPVLG